MAHRSKKGADDRPRKTAAARLAVLTAAMAEVADRPELVLVLGIAGEQVVGGTYDGEAVDEVLAGFSAYLAARATPGSAGLDRPETLMGLLGGALARPVSDPSKQVALSRFVMGAVTHLICTHPRLGARYRAAIRAGGVTLWFVDSGDEAVLAILPCGVLPRCLRGRTLH
jgi:hypothetical protein